MDSNIEFSAKTSESGDDLKTDMESSEVDKCVEEKTNTKVEEPNEKMSETPAIVNNDCTDNENSTNLNKTSEEINEANKEEDSTEDNEELHVARNVKRISKIVDSDSEDEDDFNSKTKEATDFGNLFEDKKRSNVKNSKSNRLLDSDTDEDDTVSLNKSNTEMTHTEEKVPTGFRSLIDSDSGEEENETRLNHVEDKEPKQKKHDEFTKRKVSLRASKEEAMKQIQSETQRLMRETEVSLPYHRPKQRTLEEFLNRKKILSALPKAPTMAAKLKMSSAIVDKVLKEKEKEAETFYRSSDSEEETTESHSAVDEKNKNMQHLEKCRKEIVPKKLFACDELSVNDKEDNDANVMHEANVNITEINKTNSSSLMEVDTMEIDDTNELETLKDNCDVTATENADEHILSKITNEVEKSHKEENAIVQDEIIEIKDKETNVVKQSSHRNCDSGKYNLQTDDDSSNDSSSNVTDYAKMVKQSLGLTAEESDEYNEYGLSPPKLDITPKVKEKKTLLSVQNTTPKLRGAPGTVIDLTNDVKPNKSAISAFLDRFVNKHSKIKKEASDTSKVTVTQLIESPDGSSIEVKEILPYKLKDAEKVDPKLKKPGAKLVLLKQELEEKMAQKREEEWKEKEQEMKEHDIEWNETFDEEDKLSKLSSIATYESEGEEEEEEEEDLEEDDIYEKKEKKRRKCEFVDDEADVSDDEEVDDKDEIIEEDEDENFEKDEERLILEDDESSTCDSIDAKRKPFRRIVEPIEDDSRSCDTLNNEVNVILNNEKSLSSSTMPSDMFRESPNENEKDIPVSQAHVDSDFEQKSNHTPLIKKTNNYNFVSPATQLTALSTYLKDSEQMAQIGQESLVEESNSDFMASPLIGEFSQQCNSNPKKLLFTDQNDMNDDIMEDELMELCSGKFMTCGTGMNNSLDCSKLPDPTASNLPDGENLLKNSQESVTDKNSASTKKDAIHQQQMENNDSREKSGVLSNSDDENKGSTMQEITNRAKRRVKRLELSDDEEENEDSLSSDDDIQSECDEDKFIDYDSDENEVVVVPKKNIKQYAAGFLENEAELSESDCDVSADEDEKDMDKLELEEGDDEEIDETQVKNQLGKLHMKQMLDEDQKEVRILKELLFEEGDLFSESGRERKFKWKNINKQDTNDELQPCEDKDGCVDLSDEEDEAKWRKIRHEREKFLAERMINVDVEIENDLNNSEIFKFGMKILKKRRIDESRTENTLLDSSAPAAETRIPHTIADMLNSSNLKGNSHVIHNVMRKRSILARGEESLARIAALARQKDGPILPKNGKNFVFAHIDVAEDTTTETIVQRESIEKRETIVRRERQRYSKVKRKS
ncbi:uncharacterized protein LOC144472489 [Augochlora pura]